MGDLPPNKGANKQTHDMTLCLGVSTLNDGKNSRSRLPSGVRIPHRGLGVELATRGAQEWLALLLGAGERS